MILQQYDITPFHDILAHIMAPGRLDGVVWEVSRPSRSTCPCLTISNWGLESSRTATDLIQRMDLLDAMLAVSDSRLEAVEKNWLQVFEEQIRIAIANLLGTTVQFLQHKMAT
jgi:hypothetical protein